MYQEKDIFGRSELLIGRKQMIKLSGTRVILFGVGGVGSWCAESLIRSGIGHLTMVDSDSVGVSNINRQLPATTETVGLVKVEVLQKRLLSINPHADIAAIQGVYSAETVDSFRLNDFDYIIDAIDSLQHKTHLIVTATRAKATFFSSMGAALKSDPTRIKVAAFQKVQGCPLAAALRRRLKKTAPPVKKFLCVFSDEVLPNRGAQAESSQQPEQSPDLSDSRKQIAGNGQSVWDKRKACINGTMVHITAIFGFTLAGLVIQDILKKNG
ncbi:MAG: tRNA threonylcarbamoyladenosine dehydratase [Tannerella sp.]|jgi:tRNA A37 threonylcarbamoyladenosine dehydratase|nr:tRNA threonylcarbamoyladenosine dehydratase [Tannerella sp.]